jgi:hypothetical protein
MSEHRQDGGIAALEEEFSATTAQNGTIATLIIMYCACWRPDWAPGINSQADPLMNTSSPLPHHTVIDHPHSAKGTIQLNFCGIQVSAESAVFLSMLVLNQLSL